MTNLNTLLPDDVLHKALDCLIDCYADGEERARAVIVAALGPLVEPKLQWTLDNIYTIARRETNRQVADERADKMFRHILRLCEAIGCQGKGVLRDNGGSLDGD